MTPKSTIALSLTAVLVCAAGVSVFRRIAASTTNDLGIASMRLPGAIAKYRALGLPWVRSDITPSRVPDSENAATYLKSADDRLSSILPLKYKGSALSLKNVDFQPVVKFGLIAAQQKHLVSLRTLQDGTVIVGDLLVGQKIAFLLCHEAVGAAERGDVEGAVRNLQAVQNLDKLSTNQANETQVLFALRDTNRLCHAYSECLYDFFPDPQRFSKFNAEFHLEENHYNLKSMLRSEMYEYIEQVRQTYILPDKLRRGEQDTFDSSEQPTLQNGIPNTAGQQAYLDRELEYWNEAYPAMMKAKTYTEAGSEIQRIDKEFNDKNQDSYLYLRRFGIDDGTGYISLDESNSKVRAENLLLKALEYKRAHGSWPLTISPLGPVTDPIDNKPYLMRTTGPNQISIFSLAVLNREKASPRLDNSTHKPITPINRIIAEVPPPKIVTLNPPL